jgi:site-specific recombinase XerD
VQGLAPSTVDSYGSAAEKYVTWLAETRGREPTEATVADLEAWIAVGARRGLAPRTRELIIAALRSFYTWLPGRDDNPARRVRTPRIPPSDVTPYLPHEAAAMLAAVRRDRTVAGKVGGGDAHDAAPHGPAGARAGPGGGDTPRAGTSGAWP